MVTTLFLMTLLAQGSGSTAPARTEGIQDRPFIVTKSVDGTLVDITNNVVVIKEVAKDGKVKFHEVRIDAKMKLSADKKTELGQAKRQIVLEDFKPGFFVRLTWNPEANLVVSLRIIPEKPVKRA